MFVAILTALFFTTVDIACTKGAGFAQETNVRG